VDGAAAMRTLAQSGVLPTVLRLSDEAETSINLAKPSEVGGESAGGCLMVTGYEGTREAVDAKRAACTSLLSGLGGTSLGEDEGWASGRFHGPYLRDSMLDVGVLVETLETVTFRSRLHRVYDEVKAALTAALGEGTLVLCHISHVYETGASLYFTVAAKQTGDPIGQWLVAKAAASDAMIDNGASITHHHGVGQDH
jgi:alkyldihydroxyacetonephosphate synthase